MRDNWLGMVLFGAGVLAGVVLIALLPGMPWSATKAVLDLPILTDEHDLEAQRSMAAAAWYMVAVTAASFVLGGVTLWYLRRTLHETQETTKAANLTAKAAEDALHQASEANNIAREMGQVQVRSYPIITRAFLKIEHGGQMFLQYGIANSGQTPARHIRVFADTELTQQVPGAVVEFTQPVSGAENLFDMAGGQIHAERDLKLNVIFPPAQSGASDATTYRLRLKVRVVHKDIFSETDRPEVATYYKLQLSGRNYPDRQPLNIVSEHLWRE